MLIQYLYILHLFFVFTFTQQISFNIAFGLVSQRIFFVTLLHFKLGHIRSHTRARFVYVRYHYIYSVPFSFISINQERSIYQAVIDEKHLLRIILLKRQIVWSYIFLKVIYIIDKSLIQSQTHQHDNVMFYTNK